MTLAYAYAIATGAMTTAPTCLHGVYLGSANGSCSVTITDGNGGATVMFLVVSATNISASYVFPEPIFLQGGVYVTLVGTSPKVTIAYS